MGFIFFVFLMAVSFGASFWVGYNGAPVSTSFLSGGRHGGGGGDKRASGHCGFRHHVLQWVVNAGRAESQSGNVR
jgi:hypothetical protein